MIALGDQVIIASLEIGDDQVLVLRSVDPGSLTANPDVLRVPVEFNVMHLSLARTSRGLVMAWERARGDQAIWTYALDCSGAVLDESL